MIKAGCLGAGIGIIYTMALTLLSPFCTICFTPLLGVGVGYLASWLEKPLRAETSLINGTVAGILTGLGVVLGQMLATVVNGILITNSEQLPLLMKDIGLPQLVIGDSSEYWQATLTINSFCSIFNLALIVGLGAVGGVIWFQRHNKNSLAAISS